MLVQDVTQVVLLPEYYDVSTRCDSGCPPALYVPESGPNGRTWTCRLCLSHACPLWTHGRHTRGQVAVLQFKTDHSLLINALYIIVNYVRPYIEQSSSTAGTTEMRHMHHTADAADGSCMVLYHQVY